MFNQGIQTVSLNLTCTYLIEPTCLNLGPWGLWRHWKMTCISWKSSTTSAANILRRARQLTLDLSAPTCNVSKANIFIIKSFSRWGWRVFSTKCGPNWFGQLLTKLDKRIRKAHEGSHAAATWLRISLGLLLCRFNVECAHISMAWCGPSIQACQQLPAFRCTRIAQNESKIKNPRLQAAKGEWHHVNIVVLKVCFSNVVFFNQFPSQELAHDNPRNAKRHFQKKEVVKSEDPQWFYPMWQDGLRVSFID